MLAENGVPGRHVCSGTLISKNTVLTSAHCIHDVSVEEMVVVVGADNYLSSASEQVYKIASFAQPGFEYRAFAVRNDIALLFLATCVSDEIEFPKLASSDSADSTCSHAMTVGFGKSEQVPAELYVPDGKLRKLSGEQFFHSNEICRNAFVSFILQNRFSSENVPSATKDLIASSIDSSMGCYGGQTADRARGYPCEGDSGGPVLNTASGVIVGVTSFSSQSCGTLPNYYTRVSSYSGWIKSETAKHANECSGRKAGKGRKLGASEKHDLSPVLRQLNTTAIEFCPSALHYVNSIVMSPTTPVASVREACADFISCLDKNSAVRSIHIVNAILDATPSTLNDSETVPVAFRRLVSRLMLCNSEFEMYYHDFETESLATDDFMNKNPAKDECKLITS